MAKQNRSRRSTRPRQARMVFGRRNYVLLLIGVVLVVVGFTIMRLENEVDGFLSLYVAPLMIVGGYLEVIYAILWRPKQPVDTPAEVAPAGRA